MGTYRRSCKEGLMKLSAVDHENIKVLEALDIDENDLFLLLCRYFAYRGRRFDGRHGNTPNQAKENRTPLCAARACGEARRHRHELARGRGEPTHRHSAAYQCRGVHLSSVWGKKICGSVVFRFRGRGKARGRGRRFY